MLNFLKRKKKVTQLQLAEGLWMFCRKWSKDFYAWFTKALDDMNFPLNQKSNMILTREIIILHFWIVSKALSPDKEILDELHNIYINGYENLAESTDDKDTFKKFAERELQIRYKQYYDAWHNDSGEQIQLSTTILNNLLNDGKKEKLLDFSLLTKVNTRVLLTLTYALEFRSKFEIIK